MAGGNVSGATIGWLFFGLSGRISRKAYLLSGLFMFVVQAFMLYRFTLEPEGSAAGNAWAVLFMLAGFVAVWSTIALSAKRLHDMGLNGFISLCLLIPAISIIAFLILCIMRGNEGPNQYGAVTNRPQK